jgi:hypothetical protein
MVVQKRRRWQHLLLLIITTITTVSFVIISESLLSMDDDESPREVTQAATVDNIDAGNKYTVRGTLRDLISLAQEVDSSTTTTTTTTKTYDELIRDNTPLPKYSLQSAIDAGEIYRSKFSLLRYDPTTDKFIGYYLRRHEWESGCMKLANSLTILTSMLRTLFPDRFTPTSPPFVMAVSSGDYPDIALKYQTCIRKSDDETNNGPCDESLLSAPPVLHFGSVYRNPLIPNMIAMPMPGDHLNCFNRWKDLQHRNDGRRMCEAFQSKTQGGWLPTNDNNLAWDELIPQLIWRGTDFPFLEKQNHLRQPRHETYITRNVLSHPSPTEVVTAMLRQDYDKLVPRWKGVVLTAESEIQEARRHQADTNTNSRLLPLVNIKFTSIAGGGQRIPTNIDGVYRGWKEVNFPVAGEKLTLEELSKYKYHIDLGGGGGTTWTGTLQKLAMPGLLFHHVTPTKDYFHDLIQPWVHYVPVRSNLEDLLEKLEWAESHPNEAKQISENASQFVRELGTLDGFAKLFESNMIKPLQEVIEAYYYDTSSSSSSSSGVDDDEEKWNVLLQRSAIWKFIECNKSSCQRLGKASWGRNAG